MKSDFDESQNNDIFEMPLGIDDKNSDQGKKRKLHGRIRKLERLMCHSPKSSSEIELEFFFRCTL